MRRKALSILFLVFVFGAFSCLIAAANSSAEDKKLYEEELKPLKPSECGRCHISIYNTIRNTGGKHRILCTRCHEVYHVYNPIKKNWAEIMPKCTKCHGMFHGNAFPDCLACHIDPHSPKNIPMNAMLTGNCTTCHKGPAKELKDFPSAHTDVACTQCHHTKHAYIPNCSECHEPHVEGQTMKECLSCHPVHKPLVIKYAKDTPSKVCGSCHNEPYNLLQTNITKHSSLTCAECHPSHGEIPPCERCHGKPHQEALHKLFPNCLKCHKDPHNLPIKKKEGS